MKMQKLVGLLVVVAGLGNAASAALVVNQDLGLIEPVELITFSGLFAGLPNNAQYYSIPNPSFPGPYVNEYVVQFTLNERTRLNVTNQWSDYFLLDSLAVDGTGSATGVVVDRAHISHHPLDPGTYYLSAATSGIDLFDDVPNYDVLMTFTTATGNTAQSSGSMAPGGPTLHRPLFEDESETDPRNSRYVVVPFWFEPGGDFFGPGGTKLGHYGIELTGNTGLQYFLYDDLADFNPLSPEFEDDQQQGFDGSSVKLLQSNHQHHMVIVTYDDDADLQDPTTYSVSIGGGPADVHFGYLPEPGSAALVAAAGAALLVRRRRCR